MILITGGAGYIGSHTAKYLYSKGYDILVVDDLSTGHASFLNWGSFKQGSLENTHFIDTIFSTYKIDTVIHFAGVIDIAESIKNPEKYLRINTTYTNNLLTSMKRFSIPNFIFSSTAAVYGSPHTTPIDETHPLAPISPYGVSKLKSETLIQESYNHGIHSVVFRYFNAAGASLDGDIGEQHTPETHLIPLCLNAALTQIPFIQYGDDYDTKDGSCIRDFIHVNDIAIAHEKALIYLHKKQAPLTVNLGSGTGNSVAEIIKKAIQITRLPIPVIIGPRREGDPSQLIASNQKAKECLNWSPSHSLDTIIESAWKWMNT